MISSRKNTRKCDISGTVQKDDIHPRKYGIFSDRKIKDDQKAYFYKKLLVILCTFMQTFAGVFICCFTMKKPRIVNI